MSRASRFRALIPCSLVPLYAALLPAAPFSVHKTYLQNLRADRVTIMWSVRAVPADAIPGAGAVEYGTDGSYSQSAPAIRKTFLPSTTLRPFTFYQFKTELTGLSEGKQYNYRVKIDGVVFDGENDSGDGTRRFFRTPGRGKFSFLVLGDTSANGPGQVDVVGQIFKDIGSGESQQSPSFLVHVGDMSYDNGTYEELEFFYFTPNSTLMSWLCFFTVPGNHEYYTGKGEPYLSVQAPPTDGVPIVDRGRYYSFDWSDAHFVALDSNLLNDPAAEARMLDWLEEDLSANTRRWRIAFFHHTPYPLQHHLLDQLSAAAKAKLVPLLEDYGVQLVLAGHEHNYQRSKILREGKEVSAGKGTLYVTTGGGGAVLHPAPKLDHVARAEDRFFHYLRVEVDSTSLAVRAIGVGDEKEFDCVTIPVSPDDPVVNACGSPLP